MNNNPTIQRVIKQLNTHYFANVILLALFSLLTLFKIIPFIINEQAVSVAAERYAIVITIIAIPVSLKYFAHRLKQLIPPLEITTAIGKYKNASFLRLYTLTGVMLLHIVLFGISRNMNFFWFTVVLIIIFQFCRPSYQELEQLTLAPQQTTTEDNPVALPNNDQENEPTTGK